MMFNRENVMSFIFTYRLFLSLCIALVSCLAAYGCMNDQRSVTEHLVGPIGVTVSFVTACGLCAVASILRMSAGTVLRSSRVMSFPVRPERLILDPPYTLVRNPVYLSDLIAAAGFALCMPPAGLLFPIGLSIHYRNLIRYEEGALATYHAADFASFGATTPRLFPTVRSIRHFFRTCAKMRIDSDGFRFNALYLMFLPGFAVATVTGSFLHAVVIGLPGVAYWGYWHVVKGLTAAHNEVQS